MKENSRYCDSPEEGNDTIEAQEFNAKMNEKVLVHKHSISCGDSIKYQNESGNEVNLIEALKGEYKEAESKEAENIKTKTVVQGQKYEIDLGTVINIEQKLWKILDCFSSKDDKSANVFEFCEEWWDLVDSNTLSIIHSIFTEDDLRRSLRKSSIIEFLAITMINFLSSESKNNQDLQGNLKVLIFYVHQNYLLLVNSIIQKLPPYNNSNIWVKALKKTIRNKTSQQLMKESVSETISENNRVIITLLEHIGKSQRKTLKKIENDKDIRKATKPIFSTALNICKYLDRMSIK